MADVYTKSDIAKELQKKESDIDSHLDDLKTGVESVGMDIVAQMRRRPLIYALGGLALGVVIGIIIHGVRKRSEKVGDSYTDLIERYMDGVVEEAAQLMKKKGASADEAISRVVKDRGPVFIYAPPSSEKKGGALSLLRELFMAAATPLVSLGVSHLAGAFEDDSRKVGEKSGVDA